ncbi:acyltransferase [Bradyrhizobium sp. Cp5.3]|uniref:acyltransferase family protein n=1 Tax=Bradyrhizobium sp. Cp5.3 TaxID=443598 RepID=UPI0018DC770D|nr:acyltransferase [Bradyrhizobium sp. Cp5.3]
MAVLSVSGADLVIGVATNNAPRPLLGTILHGSGSQPFNQGGEFSAHMNRHYDALDAVRFVAAIVVALHHDSVPILMDYLGHYGFDSAETLYRSALFGTAAVSIFFIVSGFCIHAPYVEAPPVSWRAYFARRYIRIVLPFCAILIPAFFLGVSYNPYAGFITWSLICEIVYYSLYPILRGAWRRFGWVPIIIISYTISYWCLGIPSLVDEGGAAFFALLSLRDVLHNLPIWLLGCLLADLAVRRRSVQIGLLIWPSRAVLALTMFATGWLHYTQTVHYIYSLPVAAPIFAMCIWWEIHANAAASVLVRGGRWSYSLYLVHPVAFYGIMPHLQIFANNKQWAFGVLICLIVAYAFYRAVELPSHRLARRIHDKILNRSRQLVQDTNTSKASATAIG